MKKLIVLMTALIAILSFNGCNGTYDSRDNGSDLTTLFLVDEQGMSYANVPYKCDSMRNWSHTSANGEFSFIEPEKCEFDFNGLDGLYGDNFDDIVRIVDYTDDGKGNIPYDCTSFGASSTYSDGSFEYNENDVCTFYL